MIQAHMRPPQSIITETTALSATLRACTSPYPTVVSVVSVKYKHIKYWICGFCTSHGTGNPEGENHSSSSAFPFKFSGSRNGAIHEFLSRPIWFPKKPHVHASQCDANTVKMMKPIKLAPVMDSVIDARYLMIK